MEALAIEMTVRQCISNARRGVIQGFPRQSRMEIKTHSLQGLVGLQAVVCALYNSAKSAVP